MIEFNFTVKGDKCEGTTNIVDSNAVEAIEATNEFIKSIIKAIKDNAADEKEEDEILFALEDTIYEVFDVEVYGIEVEEGGEYEDL